MKRTPRWMIRHPRGTRGFSMIEMMVTLLIFSLLAAVVMTVLLVTSRQKNAISNEIGSTQMARTALDMLSRDLRSAGFGTDNTAATPQPPIAYVDSMQILINANLSPYPDTSSATRGVPLAYKPTGNPRPAPLNGTSWTPAVRYNTGAETVRWTLDLNNDGVVDANDFSATDAADANRTGNPNDYELCREVYGDSTGGIAGNNGGARERIALVKRPGGSQPPMFRVYLKGDATAWNWANGPVPANRLQEIVRVEINVVATSPTKNFMGKYTDVTLTSTINEIRNAPNFSLVTYNISGIVYNDVNKNNKQDGGETGVLDAIMTLGGYLSVTTSATGSFSFDVPPGTYVLKQDPPDNYGILANPDSLTLTVGPNKTCAIADTLRKGGTVTLTVYNDVDKSRSYGGSDRPMIDLAVSAAGLTTIYSTDGAGQVAMFLPVGAFSITPSLPDSFVYSTKCPITGTMTNGGVQTASVGMYIFDSGTVKGTVYSDVNNNGVQDGGEKGIMDAYVSCTLPDSTLLYTYSDKNGSYSLKLPVNDPPRTTPYTITCRPPAGAPIGAKLSIGSIFLRSNGILNGQDFSLGRFSTTVTNLDHPLTAIAAADFVENDWTGLQTKHARQDVDLIAGSDQSTNSTVEQWFNQYDRTPMFKAAAQIARSVPQSVNAIALDTLSAGTGGFSRPDIITGTQYTSGGNLKIWLTQESTGNEGVMPTSPSQSLLTSDNGDVTALVTVPPITAGLSPDILVGTQSPATGAGVIELWRSVSHVSPNYTRIQTIPPTGAVPGGTLGAVTAMVLGPVNSSIAGYELVVGTRTGYYSGEVRVFKYVSGVWIYDWGVTLPSDAVTAISLADIDSDGKQDIIVGTQNGHASGRLLHYRNRGGNPVTFDPAIARTASGIVTALATSDYGGDGIEDVIVGWRDSDLTYNGGLELWNTIAKTLPTSGTDATGGDIKNWVTSLITADFNYGVWPATPSGTPLLDLGGTTRTSSTKGQIFTLTR